MIARPPSPSTRSKLTLAFGVPLALAIVACSSTADAPIVAVNELIPECDAYAEVLHQCLGVDPTSFDLSARALAANPRIIDAAERARLRAACVQGTTRLKAACQ